MFALDNTNNENNISLNDYFPTEYFINLLNKHEIYDIFLDIFWKKFPKYRKFDRSMNDLHENGQISMESWKDEVIEFIKSNNGPYVPINPQEIKITLDAIGDFFDEADRNDFTDTIHSNKWVANWDKRHDKIVLYPIMRWVNLIVKNSKRVKVS